jgi:hypothetical protein
LFGGNSAEHELEFFFSSAIRIVAQGQVGRIEVTLSVIAAEST